MKHTRADILLTQKGGIKNLPKEVFLSYKIRKLNKQIKIKEETTALGLENLESMQAF